MQIKEILALNPEEQQIEVKGWVRTKRGQSALSFVSINDGSTINNIQAVMDGEKIPEELMKKVSCGACVAVKGKLVASAGSGQNVEVLAEELIIYGEADESFPIQPKKHSLEFLREKAHLRFRTSTFSAVFRIRHALSYAVHQFYHERGFFNLHTPIITASDAEGAGEMFRVSTFEPNKAPLTEDGEVDFKEDFFARETSLTVSGQLEGELGAMALSKIYTFGPTFRAENSNTTRHLAEFWMIEPEVAFNDLKDNMNLAEEFIKYVINAAIKNCQEDLAFLDTRFQNENKTKPQLERSEHTLLEKLDFVIENDFARITYTEAIDILLASKPHKKKKFKFPVEWGIDLQSEHERYLVEKHFKKPVILTDYPKEIKAFYMKQNDDGKTVAAMDVLFPGIGEMIGGSQREESLTKLKTRMAEMEIDEENLWWYLDTRKFGTAPHSGFGLGFERLVQFVTGMGNIRDVIPFPRTPGNVEF
ncbi:asparagine--tRNA ligase [Arcticibacterium luteifluviistationis]|uniref:Asparagine--tRNA ligase n=1 Tax=Arcticibacterium luteifluviistationis TaxID=1784714 RepID=A0A2Z4GCN5_9BACT|nr:asparagine--tRNA ligase [Arcticibacterium luteifluviistationis]AWV98931.1 asparagine--tRNA ligase [Arcticibacterium luteifluviistationis]